VNNDALEIRKPIRLAKIAARRAGKILQDIRAGECVKHPHKFQSVAFTTKRRNSTVCGNRPVTHLMANHVFAASIAGKRIR
jgi:hypothetical protein